MIPVVEQIATVFEIARYRVKESITDGYTCMSDPLMYMDKADLKELLNFIEMFVGADSNG